MRVRDVMTTTVRTLDQHDSVERAAGVLHFWRFRHLPVVDAKDHLVGMLTPANLLEAARRGGELADEPVAGIMSKPVSTARADEAVEAAAERMLQADVHALPVLGEGERVVGIVTDQDLLSGLLRARRGRAAAQATTVDALMTRDPVTIDLEATVGEATDLLLRHGFRHLPVVGPGRRLVGLVSERDLRTRLGADVRGFVHATADALAEPVADAMTPDPVAVEEGTPLAQAIEIFGEERVGALPVVAGETLVGVLSYLDVLRWLREGGADEA